MIDRIKAIVKGPQSREIFIYLIVGMLTTIVSWSAKYLWNMFFYQNTLYPTPFQNTILSTVEWASGVLFAYPTNRKWVFKSTNHLKTKEFISFVFSRVGTLILNVLLMQLFVNILHINVYVSTMITAIVVVISNYFLSKKWVFRKNNE